MIKHTDIWLSIDNLADEMGLSVSGLARAADLDATTFNKSKRTSPDGRERWPSTESISKVLEATGLSFTEFAALGITITGEFRRRHNSDIFIQPQGGTATVPYALNDKQHRAFDAARIPENTGVKIVSPYFDENGILRLRHLQMFKPETLVF